VRVGVPGVMGPEQLRKGFIVKTWAEVRLYRDGQSLQEGSQEYTQTQTISGRSA